MKQIYFLFFFLFLSFCFSQKSKKDTIQLDETILYDKRKFKLKRIGPETTSKLVCLQFPTVQDSVKWNKLKIESLTFVNAPKKNFTIKSINLNFSFPPKKESVVFNLKLYKANKNEPIDTIFYEKKGIVIHPENIENQIFKIDLTEEKINYNDEFYVGIFIPKRLEDEFVCLSGVVMSNGYNRNITSGGGFEKNVLGMKPSINADLLIEKK